MSSKETERDGAETVDAFRRALGLNQKELKKAAEALGMRDDQMKNRAMGRTPVTRTDRLAMMAAFLEIPEFEPALGAKDAHELARVWAAARLLRAEIRDVLGRSE